MEKKPTRSSKRRGIIGCSGRRTMLQCASTLCWRTRGARRRATTARAARRERARLGRLDFHVVREGDGALDERARRIDLPADRGDVRDARREQPRHVHHGGAVATVGLDVEHRDDRADSSAACTAR